MKSLTTTTLLLLLPLGHGFSAEDVLQVVVLEESSSSSSSSTLQGRLKPQSHLHHGRQLQTAACTEEMAQDLQSVATENQQLSRQGLSMDCSCVYAESESDIVIREAVVSCIIDRGQECEILQCRDGWNCGTTTSSNLNSTKQQQDDAVVEVCQNITEEQLWVVPERNVYNRVVVRDRRVYVKGVNNIASRQVQVNREDGTCVYSVDDEPCNSCQICPFTNVAVANCTNLIPNATVTCEDEEGILVKLLELDSTANYFTTTANFTMDDDDNPNLLDSTQEVDPDDEFFDIENTDNRLGRSASAAAAVVQYGRSGWLASVLIIVMGSFWI